MSVCVCACIYIASVEQLTTQQWCCQAMSTAPVRLAGKRVALVLVHDLLWGKKVCEREREIKFWRKDKPLFFQKCWDGTIRNIFVRKNAFAQGQQHPSSIPWRERCGVLVKTSENCREMAAQLAVFPWCLCHGVSWRIVLRSADPSIVSIVCRQMCLKCSRT